jgi:hypothetical protein
MKDLQATVQEKPSAHKEIIQHFFLFLWATDLIETGSGSQTQSKTLRPLQLTLQIKSNFQILDNIIRVNTNHKTI